MFWLQGEVCTGQPCLHLEGRVSYRYPFQAPTTYYNPVRCHHLQQANVVHRPGPEQIQEVARLDAVRDKP